MEQLIDGTLREHGRLDFLFHNAGVGVFGEELDGASISSWSRKWRRAR